MEIQQQAPAVVTAGAQPPAYSAPPPQMYAPAPQMYAPAPQMYAPAPVIQQPAPNIVINQQQATQVAVNRGGCQRCGAGRFVNKFTCCGVCIAIWCFPIGIICCFLMRESRCSNCGA